MRCEDDMSCRRSGRRNFCAGISGSLEKPLVRQLVVFSFLVGGEKQADRLGFWLLASGFLLLLLASASWAKILGARGFRSTFPR